MTTEKEAIAETITAHDLLLKKLWCIAYAEGRAEAFKEAAKVCDGLQIKEPYHDWHHAKNDAYEHCAAAIRGLK